jgi:hypothetical protein
VSSNIAGSLPIHSPFAIANLGGMSSELFSILDTQDLQKLILEHLNQINEFLLLKALVHLEC